MCTAEYEKNRMGRCMPKCSAPSTNRQWHRGTPTQRLPRATTYAACCDACKALGSRCGCAGSQGLILGCCWAADADAIAGLERDVLWCQYY